MILKYGTYTHADGECEVIRDLTREYSAASEVLAVRRVWTINGRLEAANAAALVVAKKALEAAYSRPYQDFTLYFADGTLHDALKNQGSTTGVLITRGPAYPVGRGAEGGTFLSYTIIATASYELTETANPGGGGGTPANGEGTAPNRIESWSETVTQSGGGPRYAVIETIDGISVRQKTNQRTKVRITQQGQATGRKIYPIPPAPLYPNFLNPAETSVSQVSPRQEGQGATGYTTTWSYVMEGPDIGGAEPNKQPK